MKYLSELLNKKIKGTYKDIPVMSLCYDSRKISKNSIFFAIKGFKQDGNDYINDAVAKGATAIVSEKEIPVSLQNVYWEQVADVREAMAMISSKFYEDNLKKISLIGITGTNGKTTTSYLIDSLLSAAGYRTGVVGTLGFRSTAYSSVSTLTTPESIDLHQFLNSLAENGTEYAAMEVSSHAIALKRVHGLHFRIAIFTNLTRDHLDFHETIQNYFNTKKKLFQKDTGCHADIALINGDDIFGREIIQERKTADMEVLSYGLASDNDFRCLQYEVSREGIQMKVDLMGDIFQVESPLMGFPNVYNLLSACSAASLLGVKKEYLCEASSTFKGVKGRFERIDYGQQHLIIIDYAHTEDAIAYLVKMIRQFTRGRVIIVFGCGGGRDQGKRKLMGKAAAHGADYIIITSDNPRNENPLDIIAMIEEGVKEVQPQPFYEIIADREKAIFRAVKIAQPDDSIVLAGKGHEDYQIIGPQKLHFDEREILKRAIEGSK
ncbi:MAG: UDP-N-acetylmuramoyl-L-alanyl-D-glutamate--2,6-diaminopimelate ligase [Candidatus Fischerbacteria bacterium RBG_13_37_8]|uniref:UDP-N-acetylmuramoyl-L-alanyl-D-glutamate--2,6-diaminopimelate ligase n=1 Tax=Candidatus Fischerbacteria bacterium RBG_13_37_8 TaxID=1817863 RepID=A0A1F5VG44_9BACT|nr:MAG: UDP-N-acetylmuramoyl-L-alanyl-D-glutamate--2,6-diaminopimelate ligase [Candidatus Fischerbacteria bacterium RBG_13_37_8]